MPPNLADQRAALGVDIGGTRVRVGLVVADGTVLASREDRLPAEGDPARLRTLVANLSGAVTAKANVQPATVGVALPGIWDAAGVMQKAVNLPRLEGVDLPKLFADATGYPVRLDADVNAGVWGQYRSLSPTPARLLYISLGTGIGGSVILDGELVRHTRGGAGHFGFLIVDTRPGAPAGRNGVPGCLSALAAGPALHLAATGSEDHGAIGDEPLTTMVINNAARALAIGIMNLVHIYAPQITVLGGGVIDHHPEIVERTQAAFAEYRSPLIPNDFSIVQAPLSTHEAGVIGSALLALEHSPPA